MNIHKRLHEVVKEIKCVANNDPDWSVIESINKATRKYELNAEEVEYLKLKFADNYFREKY